DTRAEEVARHVAAGAGTRDLTALAETGDAGLQRRGADLLARVAFAELLGAALVDVVGDGLTAVRTRGRVGTLAETRPELILRGREARVLRAARFATIVKALAGRFAARLGAVRAVGLAVAGVRGRDE